MMIEDEIFLNLYELDPLDNAWNIFELRAVDSLYMNAAGPV